MPTLKDLDYSHSELELEIHLSPSKYYSPPAEFVNVQLTLGLGSEYSPFSFTRDCAEIDDLFSFASDLQKLVSGELTEVEYYPLEPDFSISITHSGVGQYEKNDDFFLECWVDIRGIRGGPYGSTGVGIRMRVSRQGIKEFVNQIKTELSEVEKISRTKL